MALNKKQKKLIEANKNKIAKLRQQLAGAKQQVDDPGEITRLEAEITKLEDANRTIREDG